LMSRQVGSAQSVVNTSVLKEWEVPVPPMEEQRRIAAILDQADALRAKRREALAQLDSLTQSIFIEMFGDPLQNPTGYPVRRLVDIVDSARPVTYGILMPGPDQDLGVKYIRVVDMRNGGIDLSAIRSTTQAISNSYKRSLLRAGDLLMSIRGHVGRLALVPEELAGANITQDTARFAITGAEPVFIRECLRTPGFQRWMVKHTKGVAVRGINLGDVKLMPLIIPDAAAQREFARRASAIDDLVKAQRAALAESDALFASLQHRAFSSQLS
jgi:type I restriction enzyme, S subunit